MTTTIELVPLSPRSQEYREPRDDLTIPMIPARIDPIYAGLYEKAMEYRLPSALERIRHNTAALSRMLGEVTRNLSWERGSFLPSCRSVVPLFATPFAMIAVFGIGQWDSLISTMIVIASIWSLIIIECGTFEYSIKRKQSLERLQIRLQDLLLAKNSTLTFKTKTGSFFKRSTSGRYAVDMEYCHFVLQLLLKAQTASERNDTLESFCKLLFLQALHYSILTKDDSLLTGLERKTGLSRRAFRINALSSPIIKICCSHLKVKGLHHFCSGSERAAYYQKWIERIRFLQDQGVNFRASYIEDTRIRLGVAEGHRMIMILPFPHTLSLKIAAGFSEIFSNAVLHLLPHFEGVYQDYLAFVTTLLTMGLSDFEKDFPTNRLQLAMETALVNHPTLHFSVLFPQNFIQYVAEVGLPGLRDAFDGNNRLQDFTQMQELSTIGTANFRWRRRRAAIASWYALHQEAGAVRPILCLN